MYPGVAQSQAQQHQETMHGTVYVILMNGLVCFRHEYITHLENQLDDGVKIVWIDAALISQVNGGSVLISGQLEWKVTFNLVQGFGNASTET